MNCQIAAGFCRVRVLAWVGVISLLAPLEVEGQLPAALTNTLAITSSSGQFVVHGGRDLPQSSSQITPGWTRLTSQGDEELTELEPRSLSVTSERIKTAVLTRLGLKDAWRGRIHLFVTSKPWNEQPLRILPGQYRDGWQYRLYVPRKFSWKGLVRGISEALILEIVNRNNEGSFGQAPLWFNEGISGLILNEYGRSLIIESYTYRIRSERKPDPLAFAREQLRDRETPCFADLGLPDAAQLRDPAEWRRFQAGAQLLVHELQSHPETRGILTTMLPLLPKHLNFHTAFLEAGRERFLSLLEVEKWWALAIANFHMQDPSTLWSREKILSSLASVLAEPTMTSNGTNRVVRGNISLTELIRTWEFRLQEEVLRRKALQLRILASHAPKPLFSLIMDYSRTLEQYLADRSGAGKDLTRRGAIETRTLFLAQQTIQKLNALDQRRRAL
ncbi:MAG: hypothetical protein EXS36_16645 [Pedosphaera sp.]|nr:hypothetical protein [Pedosphaera sp.]